MTFTLRFLFWFCTFSIPPQCILLFPLTPLPPLTSPLFSSTVFYHPPRLNSFFRLCPPFSPFLPSPSPPLHFPLTSLFISLLSFPFALNDPLSFFLPIFSFILSSTAPTFTLLLLLLLFLPGMTWVQIKGLCCWE